MEYPEQRDLISPVLPGICADPCAWECGGRVGGTRWLYLGRLAEDAGEGLEGSGATLPCRMASPATRRADVTQNPNIS